MPKKLDAERIAKLYSEFNMCFETDYLKKEVPQMVVDYLADHPQEAMEKGSVLIPFLISKVSKEKVLEHIKEHTRKVHAESQDITSVKDIEARMVEFASIFDTMATQAIFNIVISTIALFLGEVEDANNE
jgi:hypothetical protein